MPLLDATGWQYAVKPVAYKLRAPPHLAVNVYRFVGSKENYAIVTPLARLGGQEWANWLSICRTNAYFEKTLKAFIFTSNSLARLFIPTSALSPGSNTPWSPPPEDAEPIQPFPTLSELTEKALEARAHLFDDLAAPRPPKDLSPDLRSRWFGPQVSLSHEDRLALRARRAQEAAKLDAQLLELSKLESVPESEWPKYHYPPHYEPVTPLPTSLQRIAVSHFWDKQACYVGASVGTGKTRIVIDCLNLAALARSDNRDYAPQPPVNGHPNPITAPPNPGSTPSSLAKSTILPTINDKVIQDLPISSAVVLVIAPLVLHTNWMREFAKWTPPGPVQWRIHKYQNSDITFWLPAEASFAEHFDQSPVPPGGLVIITTPQSLSRPSFLEQFQAHNCHPTAVVVDEAHICFRNPQNKAYKTLLALRKNARRVIAMSGTPIARIQDWYAIYNLLSNEDPGGQWKKAAYEDFHKAGDPITFKSSGLCEPEWTHNQLLKNFHKWRIEDGRVKLFLKEHYLRDALPCQDSCDIGPYADMRPTFPSILDDYPKLVDEAIELQNSKSPHFQIDQDLGGQFSAQVLITRMQQLASVQSVNTSLLTQFISDILDPDEGTIVWCLFREEIDYIAAFLKRLYSADRTMVIHGGISAGLRQHAIDSFDDRSVRFLVMQAFSGGVGLNLTRARRDFYNSVPLGYLALSQCHGRLHRMGQTEDVTHYYALTHPINAWALSLYEARKEMAEDIHLDLSKLKSFAKNKT